VGLLFSLIRLVKIAENSLDYSLMNTTRQALFLPVSRDAKYDGKTAIDTFFYRTGDMTQAGVVWLGSTFAFTVRHFALVNVGFILVWLGVTFMLSRNNPVPAEAREPLEEAA